MIAVAGGMGFIGRHLVSALLKEGHQVTASWFKTRPIINDCAWVKCDLRDAVDVYRLVVGCDTVYVCAGETAGVGVVTKDRLALVPSTIIINTNLFAACRRAGVKTMVVMSSSTGYPDVPHPVKEDEYHGPLFPLYEQIGGTKRFVEQMGRWYTGMNVIFIRATNAYGPHDDYDPASSHVVAALIKKVAERQDPLVIWGDGEDVRDIIHVDDVVRALIKAKDVKGHESFNIGLGASFSLNEMLAHLVALTDDYNPKIVYQAGPRAIRARRVDVSKAENVMGFSAVIGITDGLKNAREWYESQRLHPH